MEFSGSQLIAILEQQWPECLVEVRTEHSSEMLPPATAADRADRGEYVGVGPCKRICYLKPRLLGLWRGHRTTERSRNDQGVFIGPPRTPQKHIGIS